MKENRQPKIIIIGLGNFTEDEFMEAFYNLINSSPNDILNYDESPEYKIEKLDNLIKFFEDREEFEKCANIKKIQELINLKKYE